MLGLELPSPEPLLAGNDFFISDINLALYNESNSWATEADTADCARSADVADNAWSAEIALFALKTVEGPLNILDILVLKVLIFSLILLRFVVSTIDEIYEDKPVLTDSKVDTRSWYSPEINGISVLIIDDSYWALLLTTLIIVLILFAVKYCFYSSYSFCKLSSFLTDSGIRSIE
jgi:hypothetical protein